MKISYVKFFGFLVAVYFLHAGCSSPVQPSQLNNEMIPLGVDNQWNYSISGFDSLSHSPIGGSQIETQYSYDDYANHGLTYLWDSISRGWKQIPYNHGIVRRADGYGLWSNTLIYAPYTDGTENGIVCGFDFLDSGGRYWFKLPQHPTKPLSFTANSIPDIESGDTASGIYKADFDTTMYQITVPAGSFQCYKLVFRFDGQIGIGGLTYLHTVNTIYLTPGKGIIKRITSNLRLSQDFGSQTFNTDANNTTVYELTGFQIK